MLTVYKSDNPNFLRLEADKEIFAHISEQLTARDPNCYFNPAYKRKKWDGNIKFLRYSGEFQAGLLVEIIRIAKKNGWEVKYDRNLIMSDKKFEKAEIEMSLDGVNLYKDTQFPHVEKLLKYKIGMAKLPTSSGKSYMEIAMMNLYKLKGINNQILIVPRASLVEQIYEDLTTKSRFIKPEECGRLYGGHKDWDKSIVVATWQSLKTLLELDKNYGKRFELLIQDEVHVSSASAKVVKSIINAFQPIYKYGFSATILDKKANKLEYLNLTSLFGPIVVKDSIQNLQEKDKISEAEINVRLLEYPVQKEIRGYKDYEEFIRYSQLRRDYLKKLINDIRKDDKDGNILVLIRNVDFAKEFQTELEFTLQNPVELISGSVKIDKRIEIKNKLKQKNGKTLIATTGTFSIGEDVPNLHYLILAQSRKSEIEIIQQVGRLLRKSKGKEKAMIYDIVDDLMVTTEKEDGTLVRKNFGKRHMKKRLEVFKKHGFKVKEIKKIILS